MEPTKQLHREISRRSEGSRDKYLMRLSSVPRVKKLILSDRSQMIKMIRSLGGENSE